MLSSSVNQKLIDEAHSGKAVHVWTVNRKSEMERMKILGADNVITDNPPHGQGSPVWGKRIRKISGENPEMLNRVRRMQTMKIVTEYQSQCIGGGKTTGAIDDGFLILLGVSIRIRRRSPTRWLINYVN